MSKFKPYFMNTAKNEYIVYKGEEIPLDKLSELEKVLLKLKLLDWPEEKHVEAKNE